MYISTHSLTKRLTSVISCHSTEFLFQLTASRRGWPFCCSISIWLCDISTHSLTKRLTHRSPNSQLIHTFQLTASRRGWRFCPDPGCVWLYLNSQPHEEADPVSLLCTLPDQHFNSQPHEEADRFQLCSFFLICLFQLTASRRGWHTRVYVALYHFYISTHSLTKRLTFSILCQHFLFDISTHSLTKRLTAILHKNS